MVNSTNGDPASANATTDSLQSVLLASLLNGGDGVQNLLKSVLSNAGLGGEEAALVEMMISSSGDSDGNADIDDPDDTDVLEGNYHEILAHDDAMDEELYEELESLRCVNDTLADALGACGVCWGGNDNCPECEGYGIAGSEPPDPRLFKRLIAPAFKRVQLDKREYPRKTQKRHRR